MVSGRALQDGAAQPGRGWWGNGEQAKHIHRVSQLAPAGRADVHVPTHAMQARLVQLSEDEIWQLADDGQVIPEGGVAHRSCPGSRRNPRLANPPYLTLPTRVNYFASRRRCRASAASRGGDRAPGAFAT